MDADTSHTSGPDKAGWFTPNRLLLLFCAMNMLVYLDRGKAFILLTMQRYERQTLLFKPFLETPVKVSPTDS